MLDIVAHLAGWIVVIVILWDAFATIVVPKTVERRISISGIYYNGFWNAWQFVVKRTQDGNFRQTILGAFAPISLLILFVLWGTCLVFGFALINWGTHTLNTDHTFWDYLYYSGVTFFTLGYGDMASGENWGHFMSVVEAGVGFGFLAIVIGYIPVLYGHFAQREHQIMLLDSRAGSDPTAGELLRRHGEGKAMEDLIALLKEWERWSADQLESFLSYPTLAYYRSQHDHQSWLCSLTAILDTCTLIEIGFEGEHPWQDRLHFQAKATFAMGRHVIVDLAYILNVPPSKKAPSRLAPENWDQLHEMLQRAGIPLRAGGEERFKECRSLYEPYCVSLARDLFFTLPAWVPEAGTVDYWQITAWDESHF